MWPGVLAGRGVLAGGSRQEPRGQGVGEAGCCGLGGRDRESPGGAGGGRPRRAGGRRAGSGEPAEVGGWEGLAPQSMLGVVVLGLLLGRVGCWEAECRVAPSAPGLGAARGQGGRAAASSATAKPGAAFLPLPWVFLRGSRRSRQGPKWPGSRCWFCACAKWAGGEAVLLAEDRRACAVARRRPTPSAAGGRSRAAGGAVPRMRSCVASPLRRHLLARTWYCRGGSGWHRGSPRRGGGDGTAEQARVGGAGLQVRKPGAGSSVSAASGPRKHLVPPHTGTGSGGLWSLRRFPMATLLSLLSSPCFFFVLWKMQFFT